MTFTFQLPNICILCTKKCNSFNGNKYPQESWETPYIRIWPDLENEFQVYIAGLFVLPLIPARTIDQLF